MSPQSPFSSNRPVFLIGGVVLCIIVGYTLFAASPYLLGPSLTVITPVDQSTASSPTVTISGKTSRVSYVSLNEQPIPLLEDGTFAVERSFPAGYTVLKVLARDRFGREVTDTIHFLNTYNPPAHGTQKEGVEAKSKSN